MSTRGGQGNTAVAGGRERAPAVRRSASDIIKQQISDIESGRYGMPANHPDRAGVLAGLRADLADVQEAERTAARGTTTAARAATTRQAARTAATSRSASAAAKAAPIARPARNAHLTATMKQANAGLKAAQRQAQSAERASQRAYTKWLGLASQEHPDGAKTAAAERASDRAETKTNQARASYDAARRNPPAELRARAVTLSHAQQRLFDRSTDLYHQANAAWEHYKISGDDVERENHDRLFAQSQALSKASSAILTRLSAMYDRYGVARSRLDATGWIMGG